MKKILSIILFFTLFSCSSKKDDPLVIPPNFSEMPDLNNPEKPPLEPTNQEDVSRLKELLLKSED
jgi:hypothetical protein